MLYQKGQLVKGTKCQFKECQREIPEYKYTGIVKRFCEDKERDCDFAMIAYYTVKEIEKAIAKTLPLGVGPVSLGLNGRMAADILKLVEKGANFKAICFELKISPRTLMVFLTHPITFLRHKFVLKMDLSRERVFELTDDEKTLIYNTFERALNSIDEKLTPESLMIIKERYVELLRIAWGVSKNQIREVVRGKFEECTPTVAQPKPQELPNVELPKKEVEKEIKPEPRKIERIKRDVSCPCQDCVNEYQKALREQGNRLKVDNPPIEELGSFFEKRFFHYLIKAFPGIKIMELVNKPHSEFLSQHGLGLAYLHDLRDLIDEFGLKSKDSDK